jgi:hypothetical protein
MKSLRELLDASQVLRLDSGCVDDDSRNGKSETPAALRSA